MSNDVSVTIDVANQSITSSDASIITVPTQNFEIVTFDNKPCIRATNGDYATFTISPAIKSFSCDVFLQAVNGFTLLIEFDTVLNTKYSLVYYPHGTWWNPDSAVFDRNNVLVGVWVTVTYSSTNKTITFDNGTNKLVRVVDSDIADLSLSNFNGYNIYLTNLSAETSTRYVNKSGVAEIWANIKNYIASQLLSKSEVGHTHSYNDLTDTPTMPTKTSDLTNDSGFLTSHQDLSGYVPRSGGAVMTGSLLASPTTDSIGFGYGWGSGGTIYTYSPTESTVGWQGAIRLEPLKTTSNFKTMQLYPSGTWTWSGTACQITSDQRYKQQITEIDDKLLDAWEDVELVQFKYNESVDTKGKSARLHTGYVVQQIDSACKSHGVDISEYGLYCHEEYPQETEEVEVEQLDGTKTKETKVIREANEHYSLRYTEALIVECKYLRRCIARLTARIEELEKGNNSK